MPKKPTTLKIETLEARRALTVSLVDIDLDGDKDVLAHPRSGWFENVDGQFVRRESVPPTSSGYILADIDGNGSDDVVTHTSWYEFIDGAFLEHPYADETPRLRRQKAIDLGADGDLDIIARADNREIYLSENREGELLPPAKVDIPPVASWLDMDPFDFDLDGDLDFLVLEPIGDDHDVNLSWYLNEGGGYSRQMLTEYISFGESARANELIDIDGDGDLDIFEFSESDLSGISLASWLENVGNDELWPRHKIKFRDIYDVRDAPVWKMHDSDRDGDLDAVLWDGSQLENTSEEFKPCCKIQMVNLELNSYEKGFGDINDDGAIDLISIRDQQLSWYDGTVISDEVQIAKVAEAIGTRNDAANIDVARGGSVNETDFQYLIEKVLEYPWGDSNLDHVFDTSDLVLAFRAGEYNDGIANNSTWVEGDWNGDRDFDSKDLIRAFQAGAYTQSLRIAGDNVVGSSPDFEDTSVLFDDDLETRLYLIREGANQPFTIQFDFDQVYNIEEIRLRHGLGLFFHPTSRVAPIRQPIEANFYNNSGSIFHTLSLVPDPGRLSGAPYSGHAYEAFIVDAVPDVVSIELTIQGCDVFVVEECFTPPGLHDVMFIGQINDT